jgi:Rps23 Pro-64 3,4-dihydroxylase Tpa1-like proline 4-hydroxylase
LNSRETLDFVRAVTGLPNIRWADGQATWFQPGHFLKAHTDEEAETGRLAAYVMNLSPTWDRDWGGFLQFFGPDDNVEAGNKSFADKKKLYASSSVRLNRELVSLPDWNEAELKIRRQRLIDMALKIFVV